MRRTVLLVALLSLLSPAVAEDEALEQVWLTRPGKMNYGSPGVSGDRIWVAHMTGELYGLDRKTGEVEVTAKIPGKIYGGLTATKDGIYVAAGNAVHRVDPKSGKIRWTYDFGEPVSRAPAVDGRHVFAGDNRGHIALIRTSTGKEVWKRDLGYYPARIALGGDVAILSATNNQAEGLYLLDRKTGKTKWKADYPGKVDGLRCAGFSIGRGVVYYGDAALSLTTGDPVWKLEKPARFFTTGKHAVVAVFGGRDVAGLDPETGARLWTWKVPGEHRSGRIPVRAAPAVAAGTVVVAVEEGHITLLGERTGRVIATRKLELRSHDDKGYVDATPAVHKGILVGSTTHGKTFGLRFPDGSARWPGAHGGPGQWGQSFEPDVKKLLLADPPRDLTKLDPEKGQEGLAKALAVEVPSARVEALVGVVKAVPETALAGYRARKRLASLLESQALSLSLRNVPDTEIGIAFPDGSALMKEVLAAEPLDPDGIAGFYGLDDVDIAEGLVSFYYGRRAWAVREVAKLPAAERRTLLLDRAVNDPSSEVSAMAVEGFRGDTDSSVKTLVRKALEAESQMVRRAACVVAISVLGEEGRKLLKKIADGDKDVLMRALAIEQLAK